MVSLLPAPPIASVTWPPNFDSCCRNSFIWCIEPSAEAAKKKRSVISQAKLEIGWGNWKVVRRDFDERSQSCYNDVSNHSKSKSHIPWQNDRLRRSGPYILGRILHHTQYRWWGVCGLIMNSMVLEVRFVHLHPVICGCILWIVGDIERSREIKLT